MNDVKLAHPSLEQLAAFSQGRLGDAEIAMLSAHLSECPECVATVEATGDDTLISLLRAADTEHDQVQPNAGEAETLAPAGEAATVGGLPAELAQHGRYRIEELLGVGGMGAVYKAEHLLMERPVALKLINHSLTSNPAMVERFRREVKTAGQLRHPNIVMAYDAEQAGDSHFLVMEYVEGQSMARLVSEHGPLPVEQACAYIRQAALGLQYAHERGMVHRDIKPQNLMVTPDGQVKILDFGLARFAMESAPTGGLLSAPAADSLPDSSTSATASLTQAGAVMGTPDYIAPEQARDAHTADIRADIYSLGCTLYDLLAGHAPFPEGTVIEKVMSHLDRSPKPLNQVRPDVPPALVRVVERMMAKDPAKRYQTPAEVAEALKRFTALAHVKRRPPARLLLAAYLLGAAVLIVGGWIIHVQTDKGELVIEASDKSIEALVNEKGVTILDKETGREYVLRVGTHDVRTGQYEIVSESPDGVEISGKKFTISRNGHPRVIARVRAKSEETPASQDAKIAAASKAGEAYLKKLDAGNYAGLWEHSSEMARLRGLDGLVQNYESLTQQWGKLKSRTPLKPQFRTGLPGVPGDGEYVILSYESHYERRDPAVEFMTVVLEKDGWRILDYRRAYTGTPSADQDAKIAAATEAAGDWLGLVDEGKYAESWDQSAELSRKAVGKDDYVKIYQQLYSSHGRLVSRRFLKVTPHLTGSDGGHVMIQYRTSFDNVKNIVEEVIPIRDTDGKWRVAGYWRRGGGLENPNTDKVKASAATRAAENWLKLVDTGDYGRSWDELAAWARELARKDLVVKVYQDLTRQSGKLNSRTLADVHFLSAIPGAPAGEYAQFLYHSNYERFGPSIEQLALFLDKDGQWRTVGYGRFIAHGGLFAPPDTSPNVPAFVGPARAKFVIPVADKKVWSWYLPATPANDEEYRWSVKVTNGGKSYSFGFTLYKMGGRQPASGTLQELLNAGQANVWGASKDGGAMVEGDVRVHAQGNNVVITIDDSKLLLQLFRARPPVVEFESALPGDEKVTTRIVPVIYEDSAPGQDAKIAAATKPTEAWLKLVDAGDYIQAHEQSAQSVRDGISIRNFVLLYDQTAKTFGKLKSRGLISRVFARELSGAPVGDYVVSTYKSSFENWADVNQQVVAMLDKDGIWRVSQSVSFPQTIAPPERDFTLAVRAGRGQLSNEEREELSKRNRPFSELVADPIHKSLVELFANLPDSAHKHLLKEGYLRWKFTDLDAARQKTVRDHLRRSSERANEEAKKRGVDIRATGDATAMDKGLEKCDVGFALVNIVGQSWSVVSWYILLPAHIEPTAIPILQPDKKGVRSWIEDSPKQIWALHDRPYSKSIAEFATSDATAPAGPPKGKLINSFGTGFKPIARDGVAEDEGGWKIDALRERFVRLYEVQPPVEECLIFYRAKIKSSNLHGKAYLEMWARMPNGGEYSSKGLTSPALGTTDWKSVEIPFVLQKDERPDLFKLGIKIEPNAVDKKPDPQLPENVWIKDIEIWQAPLPAEMKRPSNVVKPAAAGQFGVLNDFPAVDLHRDEEGITLDQKAWRITARENSTVRLLSFSQRKSPEPPDGYLLTFRARMKAGNLQGIAYPELTLGKDDKEGVSRGVQLPLSGTTDWASVETSFRVEKGQPPPETFSLHVGIEGKGTVWIKDIELLRGPLPK